MIVRDLGSRNGTLVNGKALTAECRLKDRRPGPGGAADVRRLDLGGRRRRRRRRPPRRAAAKAKAKASPDDVSGRRDRFVVARRSAGVAADKPTTVYGGDTITITAFKDAKSAPPKPQPPPSASDDEYERQAEEEEEPGRRRGRDRRGPLGEDESDEDSATDEDDEDEEAEDEAPEEFMDESNPFYAAKKAQQQQAKQTGPAKPAFKDTSDAAGDILRRLMERRRADEGVVTGGSMPDERLGRVGPDRIAVHRSGTLGAT